MSALDEIAGVHMHMPAVYVHAYVPACVYAYVSALDVIAGGLTHNILGATGLLKLLKPSLQSR